MSKLNDLRILYKKDQYLRFTKDPKYRHPMKGYLKVIELIKQENEKPLFVVKTH
jgi:hypothetical protein